jgi:hypothetical protein
MNPMPYPPVYQGNHRVEKIAKLFQQAEQARKPLRLQPRSFGALFIVHEIEKRLDAIGLIDRIVPRARREKGPSIGEYFFYAWANRLVVGTNFYA